MPLVSQQKRDRAIAKAKKLYLSGHDFDDIAKVVEFTEKTVRKWANEYNWERSKKLQAVSPSEIADLILEDAIRLKEGKAPEMNPKELAMLANAYEKMTDRKRFTRYALDVMNEFSSFLLEKVKETTNKKEAERLFKLTQELHTSAAEFVDELVKKHVD